MIRRKLYTDVIPFPAAKTAGATTISSDELYPFEGSAPGEIDLQLTADDDSKITDTLSVDLKVSYDAGTSWLSAVTYSDLEHGSGDPISAFKNGALAYAPRVRLDGVFDGTGALADGHGIAVHANLLEGSELYRHEVDADVLTIDTLAASDSVTSDVVQVDNSIAEPIHKVIVISYVGDASTVTDNITWVLQSSFDGNDWWDVSSTAETNIANGSGSTFTEVEETDGLGDYFRIVATADSTGAIATDNGIQFNVVTLFG